jgi:hypothetical protein
MPQIGNTVPKTYTFDKATEEKKNRMEKKKRRVNSTGEQKVRPG